MNSVLKMTDTEYEWIGTIPSHWTLKKIKFVFWDRKENNNPIKSENLISLTIEKGVIPHSEKTGGGNKPKEDLTKYKLVYPGDIVLNSMNVIAGAVGISRYFGVVSPVYYMLIPRDLDHSNEYFHHLFRTEIFQKSLYGLGNGILIKENEETGKLNTIRMRIPMDKLGDQFIPVPPAEEQKLIARYLNKKTEQIDRLVEKIQKKIELLKEQRTSLINQCVTKGLDPNVEMKDSGIEWVGEIPRHWDCKKLKNVSNITYGISPHESTYNDEGRGTVLINGPVEYSTTDFGYTRSIKWTTDPKNMVPKGSLLFCVRGSTTGRMNICHQDVSIGRGVCSIESKLDQDFTVFSMMMIRIYIQDQISGSTFPSVVKEDVDNFVLPCPPIEEQRSISKHIKDEVEVIDELIDLHAKKNVTLKEFRQSLISSVVTGKVRVTEDMI